MAETSADAVLDPSTQAFYCQTITILDEARIPFLVGGAYAFARYTGIVRHTKDFDIFVRPADRDRVLEALGAAGYHTDVTFPHWLAKAYCGEDFIDVIYSSGNGIARVDEEWFTHAVDGEVLGMPVLLSPVEEMIWSKSFVLERERYDGADVAHLLRACGKQMDWDRLLRRFGPYWRVLLSHLILVDFVYPCEPSPVPDAVLEELFARVWRERQAGPDHEQVCQGTLLSRAQYLIDVERWGYADARLQPRGNMRTEDVAHWTAAIDSIA